MRPVMVCLPPRTPWNPSWPSGCSSTPISDGTTTRTSRSRHRLSYTPRPQIWSRFTMRRQKPDCPKQIHNAREEEYTMRTARQRTFATRIGWRVTCVIPASLLSDEPDEQDGTSLRSEASRDSLSYLQVIRELEEGVYLARVAADSERVAQGYTVLLCEEQLYEALPWDQRLVGKSSERILAQIRAHAAEV